MGCSVENGRLRGCRNRNWAVFYPFFSASYNHLYIIRNSLNMSNQPPHPSQNPSNNQHPFNPFMFSFSYPFHPPNMPFLNPLHPPPYDFHHAQQCYPPPPHMLPPFGMPPFPMMFPPMHFDMMPPFNDFRVPNVPYVPTREIENRKKVKGEKLLNKLSEDRTKKVEMDYRKLEKNGTQIIILSDDEGEKQPSKVIVTNLSNNPLFPQEDNATQIKPRKTERKTQKKIPSVTSFPTKIKVAEPKKQAKVAKEADRQLSYELKQSKNMQPNMGDQKYDYFSRSSRIKYMSLKDGKGKIMIGEAHQATIPHFPHKNQNYTRWLMEKKKNLLLRIQN